MLFRSTAVLALGASAVLASPLQRRQESSTVAASPAVTDPAASTSVAVPAASGSDSTAAESATSALGSIVSSVVGNGTATGTATSSAPAATMTTEANATSPDAFQFGCPDGSSLTYVVGVAPFPDVEIEQAYSALENWGAAIPPPIMAVSSEGEGEGATRSWMLATGETNLSVSEVLTRVNETPSTFLEQEWNLTTPITVGAVTVNNYTNVLTLYTNSTDNATSVQLFSNFCVTNQTAGLELFTQLVTVYLTGLSPLFMNATMGAGNMTMTTGAAGAASTAAESASSAATTAASSASSAVSGITGTASSAISGAIETATSGAASVASAGVSGLTSAPGSVATSVFGAVTGAILPSNA